MYAATMWLKTMPAKKKIWSQTEVFSTVSLESKYYTSLALGLKQPSESQVTMLAKRNKSSFFLHSLLHQCFFTHQWNSCLWLSQGWGCKVIFSICSNSCNCLVVATQWVPRWLVYIRPPMSGSNWPLCCCCTCATWMWWWSFCSLHLPACLMAPCLIHLISVTYLNIFNSSFTLVRRHNCPAIFVKTWVGIAGGVLICNICSYVLALQCNIKGNSWGWLGKQARINTIGKQGQGVFPMDGFQCWL